MQLAAFLAAACEVCHLLKKAQHSNTRKKGEKIKTVLKLFYDIDVFTLGEL